ncbi:hypothetical protein HHK36_003160 [Tetracentron sinense]|uniref:Protein kinase domain-containing protein n=1 Tax=Tetracentron sinense TaxID=13715 RepID=A0A835DNN4_TETSI|nr:hypothetical protein HHK36_003160 [Tetracentron sinense]
MDQILISFFIFCSFTSYLNAQQGYSGNSILACNKNDETGPSPDFLYTCNGEEPSCKAFLIFKSQPPYNSVPTISNLTSSDPSELASINNVSRLMVFPTNKEVIVPVNCSCSGQYYQANTSYVIQTRNETYFTIANNTYQGLATCDSLKHQDPYDPLSLLPGLTLRVPLRCACPTSNQSAKGTKYLLTYLVSWQDSIPNISERFNVRRESMLDANSFSEEDPVLFPFTTVLIPLMTKPSSSQTIIHYPRVTSPPYTYNPGTRRSKKGFYVGIGIAAVCSLVICTVLSIVFLRYKKRTEEFPQSYGEEKKKQVLPECVLIDIASADQVMKVFDFEELKAATDNFSPKSRIKGSVHHGVFSGEILAIKKMSADVSKEVNILNKINHINLIRLYGACEDHGHFFLVYEFMENGSLKDWLRKKSCPEIEIEIWTQRVQIALDVANGLHYLHNFTDPSYVHKDIKSSNILLNGNLRAKIANFSLARSAEGVDRYASTKQFLGTRGYMAPEYLESGSITPKIDVYAFGVVMLELLTGKDAIIVQDGGELLLSAAIVSIMEGGNTEAELSYFIDPSLQGKYGMELALCITKLSVACLTREPESRPKMGEVVSTLSRILMDLQKSDSLSVELG